MPVVVCHSGRHPPKHQLFLLKTAELVLCRWQRSFRGRPATKLLQDALQGQQTRANSKFSTRPANCQHLGPLQQGWLGTMEAVHDSMAKPPEPGRTPTLAKTSDHRSSICHSSWKWAQLPTWPILHPVPYVCGRFCFSVEASQ